jgi:hypothetical protein
MRAQLQAKDDRYVGPFSSSTDVSFPGLPKGVYLMNDAPVVSHRTQTSCWFHGATQHPAFALSIMLRSTLDARRSTPRAAPSPHDRTSWSMSVWAAS